MRPVVAFTDCDHGTSLRSAVLAGHSCRTARDVAEQCTERPRVAGEVLDAIPTCRLVVRYGVGVDTVDIDAATAGRLGSLLSPWRADRSGLKMGCGRPQRLTFRTAERQQRSSLYGPFEAVG